MAGNAGTLAVPAPQAEREEIPDEKYVTELVEILGERCCRLKLLNPKRRRNGPRDAYEQEYLVRG